METTACVTCDIVFVGASVPNLLSAIALHERFECIKIKILEASASLTSNDGFLMVLSPDAWRLLMELSPRLSSLICKRNLFLEADEAAASGASCWSEKRFLRSNELYRILLSELPNGEIQMNQSISETTETSDTVTFCTKNGQQYKTKLLITDGHMKSAESDPTGFVEVAFTTLTQRVDRTEWQNADMYMRKELVQSGEDMFTGLMKSTSLTAKGVRYQMQRMPELAEVFSVSNTKSFFCRWLSKGHLSCSHGRNAISGCWSSFIPHFSSLKAEYEFEEVMLLLRAIEQKGLTAAAISYWKRCTIASSKTQVLSNVASPMELISADSATNLTKPLNASAVSHCRNKESDRLASDVGKPLVCTNVKPYMALS